MVTRKGYFPGCEPAPPPPPQGCAFCAAPATSNRRRWACGTVDRAQAVQRSNLCRLREAFRELMQSEGAAVDARCACSKCLPWNKVAKLLAPRACSSGIAGAPRKGKTEDAQ